MAKLTGMQQFLEVASKKMVSAAATEVVDDLKEKGPYWQGHFESQWVVVPGAVDIPANTEHPLGARESWQGWESGALPNTRTKTPVDIPEGHQRLTIGNRAKYRDIAMDLVPGRYEIDKNNTAEKDWFAKYTLGGGLKSAVQRGTKKAEKSKM